MCVYANIFSVLLSLFQTVFIRILPWNAVKNNYVYRMAAKIIRLLLSLLLLFFSLFIQVFDKKSIITEQRYFVDFVTWFNCPSSFSSSLPFLSYVFIYICMRSFFFVDFIYDKIIKLLAYKPPIFLTA